MKNEKDAILWNIKNIRQQLKLSQEHMANEMGIDTSTYSKIESGKIELIIPKLADMAKIFQMRTIDIITWPEVYVSQTSKPESVRAVLQIELTKDKRDQVLKMVLGDNVTEILKI